MVLLIQPKKLVFVKIVLITNLKLMNVSVVLLNVDHVSMITTAKHAPTIKLNSLILIINVNHALKLPQDVHNVLVPHNVLNVQDKDINLLQLVINVNVINNIILMLLDVLHVKIFQLFHIAFNVIMLILVEYVTEIKIIILNLLPKMENVFAKLCSILMIKMFAKIVHKLKKDVSNAILHKIVKYVMEETIGFLLMENAYVKLDFLEN